MSSCSSLTSVCMSNRARAARLAALAGFVSGVLILLPHRAAAQGRLDRSPLEIRDSDQRLARQRGRFLAATGPLFDWSLYPTLTGVDTTRIYGIALGWRNKNLLGSVPLSLGFSDKYTTVGGQHRNRIQFDVGLDFPGIAKVSWLTLGLTAQARHTADVSSSQTGVAELDVTLLDAEAASLTVGGLLLYDHAKPKGGPSQSGATVGSAVDLTIRSNTDLVAEYDFKSDFAGEDDYSVQLTHLFRPGAKVRFKALAGYAKHDVWVFGVKVAFTGPS